MAHGLVFSLVFVKFERSCTLFPVESESESRSVMSDTLRPHGLYSPWNSPGQNTGVGSLSLLQGAACGNHMIQISVSTHTVLREHGTTLGVSVTHGCFRSVVPIVSSGDKGHAAHRARMVCSLTLH